MPYSPVNRIPTRIELADGQPFARDIVIGDGRVNDRPVLFLILSDSKDRAQAAGALEIEEVRGLIESLKSVANRTWPHERF